MQKEIEASFLSIDKEMLRVKLKAAGFNLRTPEYLMRRKTFDFSPAAPGENKWGRVRQEADKVTMTVKQVRGAGINDTYELELIVDDFAKACAFFEACGIPAKSFQENRREVWARAAVSVCLDTWPGLETYAEIEGPNEEAVRQTARELGFDFNEAVFGSADVIYEKTLGIPAEQVVLLPEITFANPPKASPAP
jgi:adenylate cyclase, class 2